MSVGVEIQEHNFEVLQEILDDAAEAAVTSSADGNELKVGDFFAAAMDEGRLTELGMTPLQPDLARIEGISSLADLNGVVTDFHAKGYPFLFSSGVMNEQQAGRPPPASSPTPPRGSDRPQPLDGGLQLGDLQDHRPRPGRRHRFRTR